jgi:competence protein ComEA
MSVSFSRNLVLAGLSALLSVAAAARVQDPLPDGPAKRILDRACVDCHDLDTITGARRSKADWRATVDSMLARGASISEDEVVTLVEYLGTYVGVVNVNKATASDIEAVLGIPSKDAGAIVTYRAEHGDYKDLDDLKKVPGIDASLIEERKNRIVFR